jgi:hypothetical protein
MGGPAKANQFRPPVDQRWHGAGDVPNSSDETVATGTQFDCVRDRLPRRSAARRASTSLGSRHSGNA